MGSCCPKVPGVVDADDDDDDDDDEYRPTPQRRSRAFSVFIIFMCAAPQLQAAQLLHRRPWLSQVPVPEQLAQPDESMGARAARAALPNDHDCVARALWLRRPLTSHAPQPQLLRRPRAGAAARLARPRRHRAVERVSDSLQQRVADCDGTVDEPGERGHACPERPYSCPLGAGAIPYARCVRTRPARHCARR